ncbi:MAG: hypothetical protein KBG30_13290 [Bacteroidales bacterium]|nr:hypothetical protein [Bacteroidales bacterium]
MKNDKKWLIPVIIIVLLVVIIVLVIQKPEEQVVVAPTTITTEPTQQSPTSEATPIIQPSQPISSGQIIPATPSAKPNKPITVSCTTTECFFPYFVKCSPVELKMPFGEGTIYQIVVYGIENGKCHYIAKVVDASGKAIPMGPPGTECFMPVDKITTATVEHLFGADTAAGKETAKAEQDQLFTDYCSQK